MTTLDGDCAMCCGTGLYDPIACELGRDYGQECVHCGGTGKEQGEQLAEEDENHG